MEPPACLHGPSSRSTSTVTVAELLARYAGVAATVPPPRAPGDAVSVAALLRREGHGPHMADRPLLPRGHARPPAKPAEPPRRVRKAAAAGCALFAATAVLWPSVVHDGAHHPTPGLGLDMPLPLAGLPGAPDYDWSSGTAHVSGTLPEGLISAAMRQLFADALPSDVDALALDDLAAGSAAGTGRRFAAARYLPTPGGTQSGSTGLAVASASGTVPPGGAGTPPGGIRLDGTPGAPAPGGGAPPGGVLGGILPGGGLPGGVLPSGGLPGGGLPGGGDSGGGLPGGGLPGGEPALPPFDWFAENPRRQPPRVRMLEGDGSTSPPPDAGNAR